MIRAINNDIVINKKAKNIYIYIKCLFYKLFFFINFVSSSCGSITSSQIIAESCNVRAKYSPFSQLDVAGFQTYSFSHISCFLHSHQRYSTTLSNLHLHSHDI